MSLNKDQIIRTAIRMLDRDGLEGVTMHRLAKELGVKTASMYWHLPHKEALLDEMANAILLEGFADDDFADDQRDWSLWLNALAHKLRAAMLAHREGARVVAGAHLHIAVMLAQLIDLTLRILHRAGFSASQAATITETVKSFCFGYVIEEQSAPLQDEIADNRPKEFPTLAAVMSAWLTEDADAHFATAMRIIITGVRAERAP